jgi:hypothetical protein
MNELFEKVHCRIDSSTFPKKWPVQSKSNTRCAITAGLVGKQMTRGRISLLSAWILQGKTNVNYTLLKIYFQKFLKILDLYSM